MGKIWARSRFEECICMHDYWWNHIKERLHKMCPSACPQPLLNETDRKPRMQITAKDLLHRLLFFCCEQSLVAQVWTGEGLYLSFTFCLWRQNGYLQRHLNAASLFVLYMYLMFSGIELMYVHSNSACSYTKQSKQNLWEGKSTILDCIQVYF